VLSADDAARVERDPGERLVVRRDSGITVVVAMGDTPVFLPPGQLLIISTPLTQDAQLPPSTTAWLAS
jgi:alpha-glucosidase